MKEVGAADQVGAPRGGRGRGGIESSRGGRGRGDRARGVSRGGRGGAVPPAVKDLQEETAPGTTPESNAWGQSTTTDTSDAPAAGADTTSQWGNVVTADAVPKTASEGAKPSLLPDGPTKKTWASMFNQPKPAPAPAVPAPQKQQPASAPVSAPAAVEQPSIPEPIAAPEEPAPVEVPEEAAPVPQIETPTDLAEVLEPPRDPLTEDNLEHLPDTSIPPATQTVASTIGSDAPGKATPLGPGPQAPIGRPAIGGYASSALRATGMTPRSASYQRRVMEQQEAVVLPGHNSIDRATVQFGSMGLNGDAADVDEEREEPETRTQPPQQSPPGQPRAALPPVSLSAQPQTQDSYTGQGLSTPKQAPGLPPANPQQAQAAQQSSQSIDSSLQQQQHGQHQQYSQYARYGQQDMHAPTQKSYDPFSHQTPSGFDQYSSHTQGQSQQQHGQQGGYGQYSSAPSDYSQYYGSEQQRNAYQNYYGGSYGQQQGQTQQDATRTGSSLGSGQGESAFGTTQGAQQVSRISCRICRPNY